MKFKTPEVEKEYDLVSVFLQEMAEKLDAFSRINFNQEIIITRVREKIEGSSGVHEDGRAFDVRNEYDEGKYLYTDEEMKKMVSYMNQIYPRNDGKTTCIHHSFQGGPWHLHVQLASLTKTYEPLPTVENKPAEGENQ